MKIQNVIELSKFQSTKRDYFCRTQPYCLAFVYPKDKEPVVVKGMSEEVESYIEANYNPCIYYLSMWQAGESRGLWLSNLPIYIAKTNSENYVKFKRTIYLIHIFKDNKLAKTLNLRRMPRKWIPEYDLAIGSSKKIIIPETKPEPNTLGALFEKVGI